MNDEAIGAYWRAVYRVEAGGRWHRLEFGDGAEQCGGSPLRGPWAIVTAWNPMSERKEDAENRRAQRRLVERLAALRLGWRRAEGRDGAGTWVEESVAVEGIDRGAAVELLREFGQCAAVYGEGARAGLLFASTGRWEVRPGCWRADESSGD